jgi:hypothetical protein
MLGGGKIVDGLKQTLQRLFVSFRGSDGHTGCLWGRGWHIGCAWGSDAHTNSAWGISGHTACLADSILGSVSPRLRHRLIKAIIRVNGKYELSAYR